MNPHGRNPAFANVVALDAAFWTLQRAAGTQPAT
jgi:hypothetical protein